MTDAAAPTPRAPLLLGTRLLRILWRLLPAVALGANIVGWTWFLGGAPELKTQAVVIGVAVVAFRLVGAVVAEVLSPYRPGMRMVKMSDVDASRIATVVSALLYVVLGTQVVIYLVEANGWNESIASLVRLIRTLGLILCTAMAVSRSGVLKKIDVERVVGYVDLARRLLARWVFPTAVLALMVYATALALGYQAMANWVWRSVLWSGGALIVVSVISRFLKIRVHAAAAFLESKGQVAQVDDEGGASEEDHVEATQLSAEADPTWIGFEKIGSGLITLSAVFVGTIWVMSIWGIDDAMLTKIASHRLFGAWTLTWGDLFGAILIVAIVMLIWRLVRTVMIFIIFPRAEVDAGARYAILTLFKYISYFIGGYLGFSHLGVDTSALAVFAGAFGVAVGFGLQDIFGNFLSGLIMLVERPVRVGDLIEVGGTTGRIEAIKLRGTTIRTFDNVTITIPNSQMLGERLTNLSHDMAHARSQIEVGVSYSSDPKFVLDLLMEIATSDERVLADPAPFVRFQNFGESDLQFKLTVYTLLENRWVLASDLRTAIVGQFREKGIEIPFPQRDLHIVSDIRPAPRSGARESVSP